MRTVLQNALKELGGVETLLDITYLGPSGQKETYEGKIGSASVDGDGDAATINLGLANLCQTTINGKTADTPLRHGPSYVVGLQVKRNKGADGHTIEATLGCGGKVVVARCKAKTKTGWPGRVRLADNNSPRVPWT